MHQSDFSRQLNDRLSGAPVVRQRLIKVDWLLMFLIAMLCGYGLFILYSASGQSFFHVSRQAVRMAVGFAGILVLAQFDPRTYKRWGWLGYIAGVVLLAMVPFMGISVNGSQRWIELAGFRFQPSEIMKLGTPLMIAAFLTRKELPPSFMNIFGALVLVAIPTLLIQQQPDLGTSLLIAASGIFVIYLAGMSWWLIAGFAGLAAAAMPIMWLFVMREYQKQRVLTLFNPESDPLGSGWNIIQSMTAIGSGGLDGKGYMLGTQSQLDFLPESRTDFIFAVLAEELGLTGVVILMILYLLIVLRGFYIAVHGRDSFGRLLAGALTLTFFIYVFVNIGMVSGILPVVGVPLPMVSYGGTAMVTLMLGFGLMMSVSNHR
ncbi:rod shape-determining protein RodA [Salinibius halmophilus]|uniref:rod shape-determining protein RodA n=1 Tax=Salinibius halmophilus TaxID=1853216 RepID=UPI001F1FAB32|nr:rod shape-determining protein RodA [Salinibius halmophilus]